MNPIGIPRMLRGLGTQRGERYRLCLKVVAMWDVNGVAIAPQVHESVLVSYGALNNKNAVTFSGVTPDFDSWESCYLDGFSIVQKIRKTRLKCTSAADHIKGCKCCRTLGPPIDCHSIDSATAAYTAERVAVNTTKRFRCQQEFEVLGTHCNGHSGTVATHVDKRRQLFSPLS